jgi:hypothetical protein
MRKWLESALSGFFRLIGRNVLTMVGGSLATVSAVLILVLLVLGGLGYYESPYAGILVFLILPAVFVAGLVLIPVGHWWARRRGTPAAEEGTFPTLDFNRPAVRRTAGLVVGLTAINLGILAVVSYEGVQYMDSSEFCGQVCHSVMEPEFSAYLRSPHSRVECVECHIGPGAPWFVRSKLSGVRQVFAVAFDTFETPIPTPVENLRPSRDTCEHCHWPEKFTGDRIRVITRYEEDEANTALTTVLLMHIGGGQAREGGIHSWHIARDRQTEYLALDREREEVAWVEVEEPAGRTRFVSPDFDPDAPLPPGAEVRVMDCIDCHNRPTHIFELPGPALDEALEEGLIPADLPFVKKVGMQAITELEGPKPVALEEIGRRVHTFYEDEHPGVMSTRRADIDRSIEVMQDIWSRNVFPSMDLEWGTYENHIGHEFYTGCFRCHDDALVNDEGRTISQDCTMCHALLAWEEEDPEIISELGLN